MSAQESRMLFFVLGDKVLPWLLADERKHKDVDLRFTYI